MPELFHSKIHDPEEQEKCPETDLKTFVDNTFLRAQRKENETFEQTVTRNMDTVEKYMTANGDPKTRPVVGASAGMTARAVDMLADIIDGVVMGGKAQEEALSTEDVLSSLEKAATVIADEGERVVVASIDAIGLYPNLDARSAARQCNLELVESEVGLPDLDLRAATVFLAATMTRDELRQYKLQDYVLMKKGKRGKTHVMHLTCQDTGQ